MLRPSCRASVPHYIYGRHPVAECMRAQAAEMVRLWVAIGADQRLVGLMQGAKQAGIPVERVARHHLDKLTDGAVHQGVVAAMHGFEYVTLEALVQGATPAPALLIGLDQVQDPHNLGSLIRSAFALGAHGLFFPKDRACAITPAVTKAAAGATAHLPIARVTNFNRAVEQLKQAGLWAVGTAPLGSVPLAQVDLRLPVVLIVGSEATGMRRSVAATCDHVAHIPMAGDLGSLNAAVAGALALYETARQRRAGV